MSSHLTHQQRILRKKQKIDINFSKSPTKLRNTKREYQYRNFPESNKLEKRFESSLSSVNVYRKPSLAVAPISQDSNSDYQGSDFSSYFTHRRYFSHLIGALPPSKRALEMSRNSSVRDEHENFISKVEEETRRCFTHVNITSGRLEITPVQALNLPSSDYPVYIHFTYGDDRFKSFHAPPTAHPTWLNTDEANDRSEVPDRSSWNNRNSLRIDSPVRSLIYDNLTCSFEIDTLNIKGSICVSVKQDSFPKNKELCRLELPIFSVLDCVASQSYGQESYDRWFPLRNTDECSPREGDMGTSFYAPTSEKTYSNMFQYHPCIRLIIRWHPIETLPRERSIFYMRISLPALSISMIDSNRAREIMQISVSDIEGRHNHSEESTDTNVIVSWLQVDNQLPESVSPVIVSPTKIFRPQPAFRVHIKKNNILSHQHLESFDYFQIILQELDLHLEQQIVVSVWEFIKSVMNDMESREIDKTIHLDSDRYDPGSRRTSRHSGSSLHLHESSEPQATNADSDIDKLYIDHFYVAPIMINISFIMNPQALSATSVDLDKKFRNGPDDASISEHSTLNLFLWQVGEVVLDLTSSITDAPIKLNGMTVNHLFKTWGEVSSILQDHYLNSALGQLYRIVGSLDLVGNPVGLLSSLGVGVRDFFYEPAYAIITTPTEFKKIGRGVMKGAVSLASNTADGLLGTATNVTRSFGKGVAALTMDDIFLRNRERLNKPPLSTSGYLTRPVKDIANGVFCGVVGVIRVPYYGAKQRGAFGFILGVGKGIAGIAAKPVVGVLDAFTHTGDGIRYIVKSASTKRGNPPKRRRHANLFGPDGRLLPYSYSAAYGAHFLDIIYWGSSAFPLASRNNRKLLESEIGTEDRSMKQNPTALSSSRSRIFESFYGGEINDSENTQKFIAQSRRQTLRNNFAENVHHRESVVYTAVLTREIGLDTLVIITTLRVVVGECRQERGGSSGVIIWQSKLGNLKKPRLERSGGGTVSLVLDGVNAIYRKHPGETSFTITGDYEMLRNLFNCLNTILHNFHLLIPLYNGDDTWEEDEHNMIQIGSWQYVRTDKTVTRRPSLARFSNVLPVLEECDWIFGPQTVSAKGDPLNADVISAVASHRMIREYKQKAEYNPRDTKEVEDKKCLLRDSLILGEDFDKLMDSISIEMELTSSAAWKKDSPVPEKDSTKKPSRFNKIRKSVLSKMHRLNSQNFESSDDRPTTETSASKMDNSLMLASSSSVDFQHEDGRQYTVDEKSDDEKADDPKIMSNIIRSSSGISKLFRFVIFPATYSCF